MKRTSSPTIPKNYYILIHSRKSFDLFCLYPLTYRVKIPILVVKGGDANVRGSERQDRWCD